MKKYIILLVLIIYTLAAFSQNWQWAKHIGSASFYGERAKVISDGTNVYVVGSYGGIMYLPNDTLYCMGNNDIFIIKYDASGNELWSKTLGGINTNMLDYESASGTYDPVNNCIYLAGNFIGTANFGSTILTSTYDSSDIFVARMDLSGNFIWAKKAGSNRIDKTYIFAQPDGNVLLSGKVADTAYFDTVQVLPGGFFARYDAAGNVLWAKHKMNGPEKYQTSIVFIDNDFIIAGTADSATGTTIIDTASFTVNGTYDGFLARFDSAANLIWLKIFGGSGNGGLNCISVDANKNIFGSGSIRDTVIYGTDTLNSIANDFLITKLDENGNLIWNRTGNSSANAGASCIISGADGKCYISGAFQGNTTFGTFNINANSNQDMYITRYDDNGNCLGIRHFGEASGNSVAVDNAGQVYCLGNFKNAVNIGNTNFTSFDNQDIYLAKIDEITGIGGDHRTASNELIIYANPNKGTFNIKIPDEIKTYKDAWMYIYDNTGKETARFSLDNQSDYPHFNVANSAKGLYTVKLIQGNKSYSGQMIIE